MDRLGIMQIFFSFTREREKKIGEYYILDVFVCEYAKFYRDVKCRGWEVEVFLNFYILRKGMRFIFFLIVYNFNNILQMFLLDFTKIFNYYLSRIEFIYF